VAEPAIKVVGFDELVSGSEDLTRRIVKSSPRAMKTAVDEVGAPMARGSVPVVSGDLRGSITTGAGVGRNYGTAFLGMGEGLPYAGWIEFGGTRGRSYIPKGRYLGPAADRATSQVVTALSGMTQQEIGRTSWKKPNV
jgi:phage gpG-like protein